MVDNYNFNVVPNDEQEEFKVEFGEIFKLVEADFNKLQNRPSYAGTTMTGDTNIPEVPTAVSQLTNDADYQTWAEVNSAIGVEAKSRSDADDELQTAIGVVDGKVADEKTAREQADGVLQNNIEAEQTARQNADIGLQGQIDAITSASDVVDIVGTYAELQQYPTSGIKDNDVIKVLQDETHNDAMSYYRWSTSTSTWSYIGSEGPYYTKSESDTLLLAKQNKLTAGDNITIANDVISATDTNTTYTAGNAITIDSTDNNRIDAAIYPADFFTADATTSGTGSNITLNNTIPAKLDDVKLDGDTFQQTYSGKNLMPLSSVSVDNNARETKFKIDLPAGTYTISFDIDSFSLGTNTSFGVSMSFVNSSNVQFADRTIITVNSSTTLGRKTYNFTITDDASSAYDSNIRVPLTQYNNGARVEISNIQIEEGSSPTPYEPYVGGTASPNPDYPQDVQVVTGEQNVWVHRKNMLNPTPYKANYAINESGTETPNTGFSIFGNIKADPSTQFSISGIGTSSTTMLRIHAYSLDGVWQEQIIALSMTANTYKDGQFTTPNYPCLIRISASRVLSNFQLELGSTATTYEPYQGQSYTVDLGSTELCKLGDYQDYIYKSGDDWYVHKEVGKYTFTGNESWVSGGFGVNSWSLNGVIVTEFDTSKIQIMSNLFRGVANDNRSTSGDNIIYTTTNSAFWIRNTTLTTLADVRSATSGTPIYYALATPTDTKITDNTLIGGLNALYGAQGYDDKTILTVSATGTNLPAILEVSAFAKSLKGLVGVIGRSEAN